jgi:sugar-specific transcriptional regulator TrmB
MENIKEQLIEISSKYVNLHSELNEIESKLQEYTSKYESIYKRLNEVRELEQEIINNIEKETGKKLSPSDLTKIISA